MTTGLVPESGHTIPGKDLETPHPTQERGNRRRACRALQQRYLQRDAVAAMSGHQARRERGRDRSQRQKQAALEQPANNVSRSHSRERERQRARMSHADKRRWSRSRERSTHSSAKQVGKTAHSRERAKTHGDESDLDKENRPKKVPEEKSKQGEKCPEGLAELDIEVLQVIGKRLTKDKIRLPEFHNDIEVRWAEIYKEGLPKEERLDIIKKYALPENCIFMEAPKLNPEVKASLQEPVISRDSRLILKQEKVCTCLGALGSPLSGLLKKEDINKVQMIEKVSDACRK